MRLRVLVAGLSFIAAALAVAWGPFLAGAKQAEPSRPCGDAGASVRISCWSPPAVSVSSVGTLPGDAARARRAARERGLG